MRPDEQIDFDFRIPERIGSFTAETIRIDPFFNIERVDIDIIELEKPEPLER